MGQGKPSRWHIYIDINVIAAGSLLGVAVNQKDYSLPVDKVNTMVLHPMTFDEFMVATGNTLMLEGIREAYSEKRAYQLHDQAMDLYRTYLLVGGMPEAGRGKPADADWLDVRPQDTAQTGRGRPAGADRLDARPQNPAQTGYGKPPGADWSSTGPQETALPVGQKPPAHVSQLGGRTPTWPHGCGSTAPTSTCPSSRRETAT